MNLSTKSRLIPIPRAWTHVAAACGHLRHAFATPTPSGAPLKQSQPLTLHMVPRGRTIPSPSPYSLKLWTYLNMASIPYKIDTKRSFGPKGKSPWITLPNGENVADSQLCIEAVMRHYGVDLGGAAGYSATQLATSTAVRVMLEEHFVWGAIAIWRSGPGFEAARTRVFKLAEDWRVQFIYKHWLVRKMRIGAKMQGMGGHSHEEVLHLMNKDLRVTSAILGDKKYILGDEPCEDDSGIFGMLAQVRWALPDSPYEEYMRNETPNLWKYCERVKEEHWPDWESQLARTK